MSEEHEHKKEGVKSEHYEHAHKEPFKKLKKNYLVAINIVLAILVVILLILVILPYTNYSANYVGKKFVSYINANAGAQLEFVKAKSYGKNLYEVSVSYNGREVLVYVAKDGKIYSLQLANLLDEPDDVDDDVDIEIPKSDKPIVELFVMSYCPYGTQAEKGIIPVYELLGSKIDSSIKFVHYILHGEKETQENYRQICIREEQKDKFLPYLKCILNSTNANTPADINVCMAKIGINVAKLNNCMTSLAEEYYGIDSDLSKQYDAIIQKESNGQRGMGSPVLIINGKVVESGRDSASFLNNICQAFNNVPSECATKLSSTTPSPGFGYGSSDSGSDASC